MSLRSNLLSRIAVRGVMAAACLSLAARGAQAGPLGVDSSLSTLNFGVDLYGYDDITDPSTWTFIASAVPQGAYLPGTVPAGNGTVVPGFSSGLSAQANGTIDISGPPGNIQINGASVGLNDSGLWQPGTNGGDPTNGPVSSQLGAVIDISSLFGDPAGTDTLTTSFSALNFSLLTGFVPLSGGAFADPSGGFTLTTGNLNGWLVSLALGNTAVPATLPLTTSVTTIGGTYVGGVLTIPISVSLPVDLLPSTGLNLVTVVTLTGTLVAVPEPSTIALAGFGLVGLAFAACRRNRK